MQYGIEFLSCTIRVRAIQHATIPITTFYILQIQ